MPKKRKHKYHKLKKFGKKAGKKTGKWAKSHKNMLQNVYKMNDQIMGR
jgi:hypothetical protein